ncbi:hypothetical protein HYN59_02280 [Flavobacterium album]|uniref:Uncharacterized protein n=1 Tax=Flavobacterium album TaxID=2175091 RepID=A0A2S1QUA8_9FLAO|nr:hypothetical protein [Flavobacterium album]AWH84008.1 hypothetical protein HYN59_02280 [Flavobacterium album]
MKDNELYDFFKDRKQAFDEAPGDALWSRIESGLEKVPQPVAHKGGLSVFKKLLFLPVVGIVAAIVWMVAYNPKNAEETAKPQRIGVTLDESNIVKTVEDAAVNNQYNSTDTIKKIKVPELQTAVNLAPAHSALRPADAVIAKDTLRLTSHAVKMEAVTNLSPQIVQVQEADNTKLKLKDALAFKTKAFFSKEKLRKKESLNPEAVFFYTDSVPKEKQKNEFDITAVYSSAVRQGTANELLITPADSLGSELKVIQTDTKTEPGRTTITIKQAVTDAQFDSFTEKVKKEKTHKPGTLIIITAPGHKPFRYKVPKPVGELGP